MDPIYIPQLLKAPERTQSFYFEEFVPGFDSLIPVRGKLKVRHGGTFLEVGLQSETIVTLSCDRCLQQYNQRLSLDISELIWLDKEENLPETYPQEREIAWEDLSESLSSQGHFDPEAWLYEQLCLALPLRRLCGKDCQQLAPSALEEPAADSRWASLELLKQQLSPNTNN